MEVALRVVVNLTIFIVGGILLLVLVPPWQDLRLDDLHGSAGAYAYLVWSLK